MSIVLLGLHSLLICVASDMLLQGQDDILRSLQAIPFKSLYSLSLDPNTVHLAFIYSLLSFSLSLTVHLFMVHHGLLQGFIFLPVFLSLVFYHLMFIVQVFTVTIQFYWVQSSALVFTEAGSSSIISITTGFLLLSHLFYISMCLIIHSLYQHLSTFIILHHTIHCHISIFTTSIYINKSKDFITKAFSTIIFSIQYHFI